MKSLQTFPQSPVDKMAELGFKSKIFSSILTALKEEGERREKQKNPIT